MDPALLFLLAVGVAAVLAWFGRPARLRARPVPPVAPRFPEDELRDAYFRRQYDRVIAEAPAVLDDLLDHPERVEHMTDVRIVYADSLLMHDQLAPAAEQYQLALAGTAPLHLVDARPTWNAKLGIVAAELGDDALARTALWHVLDHPARVSDWASAARVLSVVHFRLGDDDVAEMLLDRASSLRDPETSDEATRGRAELYRGQFLLERDELGAALDTLRAAVDDLQADHAQRGWVVPGVATDVGTGFTVLARAEARAGNVGPARQHLETGRAMLEGHPRAHALSDVVLAEVLLVAGNAEGAEQAVRHALAFHERVGMRPAAAEDRCVLGRVLTELGRRDESRESWERALGTYAELGYPRHRERCRLAIARLERG